MEHHPPPCPSLIEETLQPSPNILLHYFCCYFLISVCEQFLCMQEPEFSAIVLEDVISMCQHNRKTPRVIVSDIKWIPRHYLSSQLNHPFKWTCSRSESHIELWSPLLPEVLLLNPASFQNTSQTSAFHCLQPVYLPSFNNGQKENKKEGKDYQKLG